MILISICTIEDSGPVEECTYRNAEPQVLQEQSAQWCPQTPTEGVLPAPSAENADQSPSVDVLPSFMPPLGLNSSTPLQPRSFEGQNNRPIKMTSRKRDGLSSPTKNMLVSKLCFLSLVFEFTRGFQVVVAGAVGLFAGIGAQIGVSPAFGVMLLEVR